MSTIREVLKKKLGLSARGSRLVRVLKTGLGVDRGTVISEVIKGSNSKRLYPSLSLYPASDIYPTKK